VTFSFLAEKYLTATDKNYYFQYFSKQKALY